MMDQIFDKLKDLDIKKDSNLYIDVGTSIDAPNAAQWFLADEKAVVIGIEPSKRNIEILTAGRDPEGYELPYLRLSDMTVQHKGKTIKSIAGRFVLLPCAIDLVPSPTTMDFYYTEENTGCSSLLKPTDKFIEEVGLEKIEKVAVLPLCDILDKVEFSGVIMAVKTDTQGKDHRVIQSLRHHLHNVMILFSEYNTTYLDSDGTDTGVYEGAPSREESVDWYVKFQQDVGFKVLDADWNNILMWNERAMTTALATEDDYHLVQHLCSTIDWFGE